MSRTFAQPQYAFQTNPFPVTGHPLTLSAWARPTTYGVGEDWTLISVENAANDQRLGLRVNVSSGMAGVYGSGSAVQNVGYGLVYSNSGGSPTVGTWNHYAGVFPDYLSRTVYLNGAAGAAGPSTGGPPAAFVYARVGQYWGGYEKNNGDIGECAVWAAALTADEIVALSKGVSPLLIRPSLLIIYWPIYGDANPTGHEQDRSRSGLPLYNQGYALPKSDLHPRVFQPWHTTVPDAAAAAVLFAASASFSFAASSPTLTMPVLLAATPTLRVSAAGTLVAPGGFAATPTLGFAAQGLLQGHALFAAAPTIGVSASGALKDNPAVTAGIYSTQTNKTAGVLIHEK